ncbi:hypothetical protein KIPB_008106, partial [Kipferlia bialata]
PLLTLDDLLDTRDGCIWLEEINVTHPEPGRFSQTYLYPGTVLNTEDGCICTLERGGQSNTHTATATNTGSVSVMPVLRRGESTPLPVRDLKRGVAIGSHSYHVTWDRVYLISTPVMWQYQIDTGVWTMHPSDSAAVSGPSSRGVLFRLGGRLVVYTENNETWLYHTDTHEWERHTGKGPDTSGFAADPIVIGNSLWVLKSGYSRGEFIVDQVAGTFTVEGGWVLQPSVTMPRDFFDTSPMQLGTLSVLSHNLQDGVVGVSVYNSVSLEWTRLFNTDFKWTTLVQLGYGCYLVGCLERYFLLHLDEDTIREQI